MPGGREWEWVWKCTACSIEIPYPRMVPVPGCVPKFIHPGYGCRCVIAYVRLEPDGFTTWATGEAVYGERVRVGSGIEVAGPA